MTNRSEVESAIKQLPESEVRALANWLQDYLDEMWDRQIEADLASGKLAPLIAQAEEDMATNNVRDIDEVLRNTPAKFQVTSPPFRWDEAGGIRIGSSRVTLDSILASYHNGSTPEEIAIQFSVLRLEDIYSAIAYYLNHRQEIDSYLEQRDQQAQQLRQQLTQKHNLVDLRQRLLARYQSKGESRQSAPSN
ncbi:MULTISPECIES: DUF433 domain-containing protein [unclassified Microcystis]|jgi:uncharacterized protein (DUF433 family)|uniref:DUF433 domain-containing protein n=1 Tax=unclassified Microcystis TaxID=2643300 RepID=UPI00257A6CC1|nr:MULTISPECIES: DUF433 domain-containing protein [unclassified Microcystis]